MITGEFRDKNDVLYRVEIGVAANLTIGEDSGLEFGGDPVKITCDIEDSFEHVIRQSATITLKTKDYIGGQLFANNARDVTVKIFRNNVNIFSGYAEPCSFSQPFVTIYDEFTINCTDALTVLDYSNYKDVTAGSYGTVHTAAGMQTFLQILTDIFHDILTDTGGSVFYDNSKGISSGHEGTLFSDLSISELVMLGESYDDVWTRQQTLEEMLRYLNLHVIQQGPDFYIFDWDSLKQGVSSWSALIGSSGTTYSPLTTPILNTSHASDVSDISVSDVYNQIQIECNVIAQDVVITSPLEDEDLISAFASGGKVKYLTEFISEGNGESAWEAFQNMVAGNATSYDGCKQVDWYAQILKSVSWNLYKSNNVKMDTLFSGHQTDVLKYLEQNRLTPLLVSMGMVEKQVDTTDNSLTSKIDMSSYLVISVNGSYRNEEVEVEANVHPSDSDISGKNYAHGLVEFIGGNAGGAFSPVDDETTNYLVFSGKLCLMPLQWETDRFKACQNQSPSGEDLTAGYEFHHTVPSDKNSYGRYYTRKFYTNDSENSFLTSGKSLHPFTEDKSSHQLQYNYSGIGDGTDRMSKLAILECELIIGDKRCVEINMDANGNSEFVWVDKNSGVQQTYVDENGQRQTYLKKTFSLGVNPKIGDYIVGDEFPLQNTISYTQNIDAEGTAIPIKMSDHLSGSVEFRILGPVNQTWNDITRRHPSFWRHTSWGEASMSVLSHTENIWIKDFECKIYTDAGGSTSKNKNLCYCSNMTQKYISSKDDITFELVTQLTADEANSMGVTTATPLNAVINTSTRLGQTSLYNARTGETAKAEEHYVNQYYQAYSTPKLIYEFDVHDDATVDFRNKFTSSVLGKTFFVMGMSRSLRFAQAHLKLKEV